VFVSNLDRAVEFYRDALGLPLGNQGSFGAEFLDGEVRLSVHPAVHPDSKALVGVGEIAGKPVLLAKPQTFMNCSGETVGPLVGFYRVPLNRLLVAVDDADLPFGEIRLRPSGSSGGHHGLESVEQHLSSREYARLRIGIGRKDGARQISNYVLGKFEADESGLLDKILSRSASQIESWLESGLQKAMSQFNGVVDSKTEKEKT